MPADDFLKSVADLKDAPTVQRVFGEPIEVGEKTFIPIACVGAAFGGGLGSGRVEEGSEVEGAELSDNTSVTETGPFGAQETHEGEGAGGGGMMVARPVSLVEISDDEATIHPIIDLTLIALGGIVVTAVAFIAVGIGFLVANVIMARRLKRAEGGAP